MKNSFYLLIVTFLLVGNSTHQLVAQETTAENQLEKYSKLELVADFNLLVNSLKETHTGLYWYSTETQFDSIVQVQRLKIEPQLNGLELYNILAPIVAFTKEDHCNISLAEKDKAIIKKTSSFLPIEIRYLNNQTYILNNPDDEHEMKGWILKEVNGIAIETVYESIFNTFASDGYIETSKYRWLENQKFSYLFGLTFGFTATYHLLVENPLTEEKERINLQGKAYGQWITATRAFNKKKRAFDESHPAFLKLINDSTAILTLNTFSTGDMKDQGVKYERFISESFEKINEIQIKHLIIDIRENGGGTEGNADYLFSYLTDKPYRKYKYVECSAYNYSFIENTDWSGFFSRLLLKTMLKIAHFTADDGRIIRKQGRMKIEPLKDNPFMGNLYILTSGWTYSAAAEFSSLVKQHTNAVFIGEEVGGGYYGNTSGWGLGLTLPNTEIVVDIPILKFALDVDGIEFGRGVIPDYPVQPTVQQLFDHYDAEMELAKNIIVEKND